MWNALDLAADPPKRIEASEAKLSGRYQCPICRVRVSLVRGAIQRDHFRHAGRTPLEKQLAAQCDLYVAGGFGYGPYLDGTSNGNIATTKPPRLYVGRQEERYPAYWSLFLSLADVPEAPFAFFRIEDDAQSPPQDPREIPRGVLFQRRRFLVRTRPGEYRVSGFDSQHHEIWSDSTRFGLNPTRPNPFSTSASGGFQLDSSEPLVRGQSYLLVCYKDVNLTLPPSGDLLEIPPSATTDPGDDWTGYLIIVPIETGVDFENWCRESLARQLVDPQPHVQIVYPPAYPDEDGRFVIPSSETIVLGLGNGWGRPIVEIHDRTTGHSKEWTVDPTCKYCCLAPMSDGQYAIYVRDDITIAYDELSVQVVTPEIGVVKGVTLVTAKDETDQRSSVDLVSDDAMLVWSETASGKRSLIDVTIPESWSVDLTSIGPDGRHYSQTLTTHNAHEVLQHFLATDSAGSQLDAGALGVVHWRPILANVATNAVSLPPALERRIRWLSLAHFLPCGTSSILTDMEIDTCVFSQTTRDLVRKFVTTPRWPDRLRPLAQSVKNDLVRLCTTRVPT